ncbi:hypothetical protein [Shigella phage ESh32]|nr:hypothetical protein [Shigella phage ESh32]
MLYISIALAFHLRKSPRSFGSKWKNTLVRSASDGNFAASVKNSA